MGGDAVVLEQDLHGVRRRPDVDLLLHQGVRNAVIVPVDVDVVVDSHAGIRPFLEGVRGRRQGKKRRAVQRLEHLASVPGKFLESALVEPGQQPPDRLVEFGQAPEGPVAKHREDPPLHEQHAALDLGLVPGLSHPCRDDRRPVMGGHGVVSGVDVRLVPARLGDPAFKVVGNEDLRNATHERERPNVGADPVRQGLRPRRLGVRVVRGAHHRHEDLRVEEDLPRAAVHNRYRLAGVVDEQFLAGPVILSHHQIDLARPLAVQIVEPGELVAVRVGPLVLFPQQHLRDALAAKFLVDVRPVRQRAGVSRRCWPGEQQPVQHRVVQRLGQWP
jgi:hypothetical protein